MNYQKGIAPIAVIVIVLIIAATIVVGIIASREKAPDKQSVIESLYSSSLFGEISLVGEISECIHNGDEVYSVGINAYDAGGAVYDIKGSQIGICNWAFGMVDPICKELESCEQIYVVEDNIWGYPPVDKYNLENST